MALNHRVNGNPVEVKHITLNSNSVHYMVKDGKLVFADSNLYLSGPNTYTNAGSAVISADGILTTPANWHGGLILPALTTDFNTFEVQIKCTGFSTAESDRYQRILTLSDSSANTIRFGFMQYTRSDGTAGAIWIYASNYADPNNPVRIGEEIYPNRPANEQYIIKAVSDGATSLVVTITDWDGNQLVQKTYSGAFKIPSTTDQNTLGYYNNASRFTGSIDLKETYVKANGALWFYGKNYASQNIAPVPSGYTYGTTTTSAIGFVDMRTQVFTAAPTGATLAREE